MPEPRWRDLAGPVGRMEPGPRNAITDVPGVRVGHSRAASGQRTGVTVVAPPALPAAAGVRSVNGVGELTAKLEIDERGVMETPVHMCGSHAVGTVFQAAVLASGRGPDNIVLPVVGECDDGDMADSRTVSIGDVDRALAALGEEVAELWAELGASFQPAQILELIVTAGWYHLIGFVCNGARVELEEWAPRFPPLAPGRAAQPG